MIQRIPLAPNLTLHRHLHRAGAELLVTRWSFHDDAGRHIPRALVSPELVDWAETAASDPELFGGRRALEEWEPEMEVRCG